MHARGTDQKRGQNHSWCLFFLGCPGQMVSWKCLPHPDHPPDHGLFKGGDNSFDFLFFWPHDEGLCWRTRPLIQGPSFMTKGTSPSFPLCIPQNQWHLEYWRFPVVKDLLTQRSPLSAHAKQKDRGPGGFGWRPWRQMHWSPGPGGSACSHQGQMSSPPSRLCFPSHCKCYLTKAITLISFPVGSVLFLDMMTWRNN